MVHRSFLNENPNLGLGSNERLEYLGDSVVGLVVSDYLYNHFPDATEGGLTAMRASVVRAQTLGRVARELGLGDVLLLSRGEVEAGGRTRRRLLAQAYEAVVGALYVDQGSQVARDFVLHSLAPELERLESEPSYTDAKSALQVLTQADVGIRPTYVVVSETGPGHRPYFVVEARLENRILGVGEGNKKQDAEQAAARVALQNWPSTPKPSM